MNCTDKTAQIVTISMVTSQEVSPSILPAVSQHFHKVTEKNTEKTHSLDRIS